jgi:cytochrome c553
VHFVCIVLQLHCVLQWVGRGGNGTMLARLFSTIVGAGIGLAIVAVPVCAADDIEAKAQVCSACHGQNGLPLDPKTMPIIWGQQQSYLVKQLHDYRSGDRDSTIMSPIAKGLEQGDLRKIAAYFAAKTWPAQNASATSISSGKGVTSPKGIAQCQACHQTNFEGGPPAPRLAGLSYEYLVAEMHRFAGDERTNNGDMPKFMQPLTVKEREAMARYIAAPR